MQRLGYTVVQLYSWLYSGCGPLWLNGAVIMMIYECALAADINVSLQWSLGHPGFNYGLSHPEVLYICIYYYSSSQRSTDLHKIASLPVTMAAALCAADVVSCGYCMEGEGYLLDPKLLPCQHVFCVNCLKDHCLDKKNVVCSICKWVTKCNMSAKEPKPPNFSIKRNMGMMLMSKSQKCYDLI